MVVQRLETFRVFRIVGKAHEFLGDIAGLVRRNLQELIRTVALHGFEALDESGRGVVVLQVVERKFVGRERLCRRDLVPVVLLPELGDGLHGVVLLVVEKQRLPVVRIGLLESLVDRLILILFRHNTNVFK